jgi:hypothetical protein
MTTKRVEVLLWGFTMVAENQVTSAYKRVRHSDFMVACIHTGYTFRCISDCRHSSYGSHHA